MSNHSQDQNRHVEVPSSKLSSENSLPDTTLPAKGLTGMRHCKILGIYPFRNRLRNTVFMNKPRLRMLAGILTKHCPLNKHMHYMGLTNSLQCRSWGMEHMGLAALEEKKNQSSCNIYQPFIHGGSLDFSLAILSKQFW